MLNFKRILCPIDYSDSAYQSLEEAIFWLTSCKSAECKSADADIGNITLCLLHVLSSTHEASGNHAAPVSDETGQHDFDVHQSALQRLQYIIDARTPPTLRSSLKPVVLCGNPASEILRWAAEDGCDLIVMATHGMTGWRRLVLGSVTENVIRGSSCPVIAVRSGPQEGRKRNKEIKTILCPTDFSSASFSAFPQATQLATNFGAQLHFIHVLEPLSPVLGIVSIHDFNEARCSEAAQALLSVIARDMPQELRETTDIHRQIRIGSPAEEIVTVAQAEKADLIIMSTHGQTGWRNLVFGSVAEEVVRTAPCPVMTIYNSPIRSENNASAGC